MIFGVLHLLFGGGGSSSSPSLPSLPFFFISPEPPGTVFPSGSNFVGREIYDKDIIIDTDTDKDIDIDIDINILTDRRLNEQLTAKDQFVRIHNA